MRVFRYTLCVCLVLTTGVTVGQPLPSLPLKRIFEKPWLAGTRPSVMALSPDGGTLLFTQDTAARGDARLWSVSTTGGNARQVVDSAVSACTWSADGKRVAVIQKGDVYLADRAFRSVERLTDTKAMESQPLWSPDGKLLAVVTDNIYLYRTTAPGVTQVTTNTAQDVSYGLFEFSRDGRRLLFGEYDQNGLPEFIVPQYTGKHVTTSKQKGGFARIRVGLAPTDTGSIVWVRLPAGGFFTGNGHFSPDGNHILLECFSTDRKTRTLYVCDTDSGSARAVYTERDTTWIEEGILDAQWMPDGSGILLTSERSGWNHLYLMARDSTDIRQLTRGEWEVHWFDIDPDGRSAYYVSNEANRAAWGLYRLDLRSGARHLLSHNAGTYEDPILSHDGRTIVCSYSSFNSPAELYALRGTSETRLTRTIPDAFTRIPWVVPAIVHFTASDGATIPAMIYKPAHLDTTSRHPCVIFVHGAGYLQNVYNGWSYYHREYMFHTYLVTKGYIVFEVDYRGSAGYGRKYRGDVYMHLGGRDLQDELDGIEYLKGLGYIDSTRIGMYGGSYGGFLPLMALFTSPRTLACGAALRAVTSWENYYHHNPWYTGARLGSPEQNPEAYRRSSPLTFADSLARPLLILHGVQDDNVFFQDAVQLVDKLQQADKKFDLMIYPREGHAFADPASWYDEYRRIDGFFDDHLLHVPPGRRPIATSAADPSMHDSQP